MDNTIPSRNRTSAVLIAGLATLGIVAVGVFGAAQAQSPADAAAQAPDVDWSSSLAILDQPSTEADALPIQTGAEAENDIDGTVDASSARFLGETDSAKFWVAESSAGRICLVTELVDVFNGTSCVTPAEFAKSGIGVQLVGYESDVRAYLVPDAYIGATGAVGLTSVSPNLLVGDADSPSETGALSSSNPNARTAPLELVQFEAADRDF